MALTVSHLLPVRCRRRLSYAIVLGAVVIAAGCSRDKNTVYLTPPFNDSTKIGEMTATWKSTGEERAFADGRRLDAPQVRLQYSVNVRNRLGEKAFLRLQDFHLNAGTEQLGSDTARIECTLPVGDSSGVLTGELWIPKARLNDVSGFGVTHYAVPLSDRGRALYREWSLQGRPDQAAAVDAELGAYATAPPCPHS